MNLLRSSDATIVKVSREIGISCLVLYRQAKELGELLPTHRRPMTDQSATSSCARTATADGSGISEEDLQVPRVPTADQFLVLYMLCETTSVRLMCGAPQIRLRKLFRKCFSFGASNVPAKNR